LTFSGGRRYRYAVHNDKQADGRSVIFDLDGTILDTIWDIARAMNAVLQARGYDTSPADEYRRRVGWGLSETVRRSLPPDDAADPDIVRAIAGEFKVFLHNDPVQDTVAYPGIPELLRDLADAGVALLVHTNKPHTIAQAVITAIFPDIPFAEVLGQRDDVPPKPDPAGALQILARAGRTPDGCWFVGDSEVDIETARNAGCVPVGVAWGYRDVESINAAGPAHLCYSVDQLRRVVGLDGEGEIS
jgi:phosphoglycolate phosphatase